MGPPTALLETLDPIGITAAADFDVQLESKSAIRPWKIKVANESPYAIRIDVGGYQDWIGPWIADVVPVGSATVMHVHPAVLGAALPTPPQSVLLVTLAPQGEDFPGTYPMALNRQTASYGQQQAVPGFPVTVPRDGNTHDLGIVSVPPGTHAIGFAFNSPNAFSSFNVIGGTTGVDYADVTPPGGTNTKLVKVFSGLDSSVHVFVTMNGGGGNNTVSAVFIPDAELVSLDPDQPGAFYLNNSAGNQIATETGSGGQISLAETLRWSSAPPWLAALARPARFGASVAANSTATVIAGVANQIVYLHGGVVSTDTALTGNALLLEATDGTAICDFGASAAPLPIDYDGAPNGTGNGIRVHNADSAAHVIRAGLGYSQQ